MDNKKICIVLYADDIVLLAKNNCDMQHVLNIVNKWCMRWGLNVNITNSSVEHSRKGKLPSVYFQL